MKNIIHVVTNFILFASLFSNLKLNAQTHPLSGKWKSEETSVKVREKKGFMKYEFHDIRVIAVLHIDEKGSTVGRIGTSNDFNTTTEKNKGNPEKTGISFIIKCGKTGKLSADDPINEKEVQLWIKTERTSDEFTTELRQMEFMDPFPMGELKFKRIKEN